MATLKLNNKNKLKLGTMFYISELSEHFTHALTLQTSLKTRNLSPNQMSRNIEQAKQSIHYLRMRLNRTLCGNGWYRNKSYTPIFIPMLEGTLNTYDHNKTLHYHVALGNLPDQLNTEQLTNIVTEIWSDSIAGTKDVLVQDFNDHTAYKFSLYVLKEFDNGNIDVVDYNNAQLPRYLR
jgi:hypothetical protein